MLLNLFKRLRPAPSPRAALPPGALPAAGAPSPPDPPIERAVPGSPGPAGVVIDERTPLFDGAPIPKYPEKGRAIPAAPPEVLLATQSGLVAQLRNTIGLKPEHFDRYVLPVLERFAAFVHLLPASESHHHCGQGGLLRHSLEVAFYAARYTEGLVFAMDHEPAVRKHLELRYRLAIAFAGLLHDAGKVVMDIGVVDPTGSEQWHPHASSLYDWLVDKKLQGYYLFWKGGQRHQRHEPFAVMLMHRLLGEDTIAFMCDRGGAEVMDRLGMALSGVTDQHNPIPSIVTRFDAASVEDDLRATRDRMSAIAGGAAQNVAVRVLQVLRRLVREGTWSINQPGAHLWVTDLGVFAAQPEVLKLTLDTMARAGERGIPTDPVEVLRLFVDAGFLGPYTTPNGNLFRVWPLSVTLPTPGQTLTLSIQGIKFERPDLLFESAPLPAPLKATVAASGAAATPAPVAAVAPPPPSSPDGESAASPAETPSSVPTEGSPQDDASASRQMPREVVIVDRREANDADRQHYVEGRREQDQEVASEADAKAIFEQHPREGTFLLHAIDKAQKGVALRWEYDLLLQDDRVVMSHEDAFGDVGVDAPTLMEHFKRLGWIEPLPSAPDRLVVRFTGKDKRERRGFRFSRRLTSAILALTNPTDHPAQSAPAVTSSAPAAPVAISRAPVGEVASRKSERSRNTIEEENEDEEFAGVADDGAPDAVLMTNTKKLAGAAVLEACDNGPANTRVMDEHFFKICLVRKMRQVYRFSQDDLTRLDEAAIQNCVGQLAKALAIPVLQVQDILMTEPFPLLQRKKPGVATSRVVINPRFRENAHPEPVGFFDRYPKLSGVR